jgi:thioester reductase-like protein
LSDEVLITGATGFVGMEVLARYLERSDRRVIALVRAGSDEGARSRVDGVLQNMFGSRGEGYSSRVQAVAADLTAPRLGLARERYAQLAERVRTIVHSAASVSFTLPLEEARAINVTGTRRMLDFAECACEHGGLERYGHVSTAYVAGTFDGRFNEEDVDVGQRFNNTYEQSKLEAEQLVRARGTLPFTIMRPSIVVGDRYSGWTYAFNVLYWPLRAFARGLFTAVPAIATAPVDVVSVDYVADAIHALCEQGAPGTYHLTAAAHASTIGEIAAAASRYFDRPVPAVVPPAEFGLGQGAAVEGSSAYFPYFSIAARFDDTRSSALLGPAGISVTPLREYLDRLLDFATRSRWGKRPIGRAEALGHLRARLSSAAARTAAAHRS